MLVFTMLINTNQLSAWLLHPTGMTWLQASRDLAPCAVEYPGLLLGAHDDTTHLEHLSGTMGSGPAGG